MQSVGAMFKKRRIQKALKIFFIALLVFSQISITASAEEGPVSGSDLVVENLEGELEPVHLVSNLIGDSDIEVRDVIYRGDSRAAGNFSGGREIFGIDGGVVLSTGNATDIIGPNMFEHKSTSFGLSGDTDLEGLVEGNDDFDNSPEGEPQLFASSTRDGRELTRLMQQPQSFSLLMDENDIKNDINTIDVLDNYEDPNPDEGNLDDENFDEVGMTNDAAVLEFEFKPKNDKISFQYVLSSEEYPEYIEFSDVFGFFVNGNNVAWVPDTDIPVTISTINHENNSEYYIDNPEETPILNTSMDGMTVVLSAEANVNVGKWNHIKLAIADFSDDSYDSNILIKSGSLDDREAQPGTFEIGEVTVEEQEQGLMMATINANRQGGTDGVASVAWSVDNPDGTNKADGRLSFDDGQVEKSFQVEFNKNEHPWYVTLSNPTGGAKINPEKSVRLLTIDQIRIEAPTEVAVNETFQLAVVASYLNEAGEDVSGSAMFKTTDENVISVGENGLFTAKSEGKAVITAMYEGKMATVEIEVLPALEDLVFDLQEYVLPTGESQPLTVRSIYSDGYQEDVTEAVVFDVVDESVATVSEGVITAISEGTTTLTAHYQGLEQTATIHVLEEPEVSTLLSLTPIPSELNLEQAIPHPLQVIANYTDGQKNDVTDAATYESSNKDVVTVSNQGVAIGVSEGTAEIAIQFENRTVIVPVKVLEETVTPPTPVVTDINFDADSYHLLMEEEQSVSVTATYSDGTTQPVTSGQFDSSNPEIATVSEVGSLQAISPGTTTITVLYEGLTAETSVEVKPLLTGISFDKDSYSVKEGDTTDITVTAHYSDDSQEVVNATLYVSSDESIATVDSNDVITGVSSGSAQITADYEGFTAVADVLVEPVLVELESEFLHYEIEVGETKQLLVNGIYSDDSSKDVTADASYTSAEESIASIDQTGLLTAVAEGTTTVTVSYEDQSVELGIEIIEKGYEEIYFDPSNFTLKEEETDSLSLLGVYEDGTTEPITEDIIYSSLDESIATVNEEGVITAVRAGAATITATYDEKIAEARVEVLPVLTGLLVDQSKLSLKMEETKQLNVKALYSDQSMVDIREDGVFTSSNPDVAEVSEQGLITAVEEGEVVITVTYEGLSETIDVTVLPKQGIELLVVNNANGQLLSDVIVMLEEPSGTMTQYSFDGEKKRFQVEAGTYKLYVYKTGFAPVMKEVTLEEDQRIQLTVGLKKSALVDGEMEVESMTIDEIKDAGIDTTDPDNQWVYEFKLYLAVEGKVIPKSYYVNGSGRFVGSNVTPIAIGGGVNAWPVAIPYANHPEVAPTVGYLIIPGEVGWLKEFFKVQLTLQNLAEPPFSLNDSAASLQLPEGLSLAPTETPQSMEINLGDIEGGEKVNAEWYLRGDAKGTYNLEAQFNGTLFPFNEAIQMGFATEEAIRVWGDDALKMVVEVEKNVNKGLPYHTRFTVKNVSDVPVYQLKLELKNEGKANYIYAPYQQLARTIEVLGPEDEVSFDYLLIPLIEGTINLEESFAVTTGGNARIPVEFEIMTD